MNENEFLDKYEKYFKAIQERIYAFFVSIGEEDIKEKIKESVNLWNKLIINESKSFSNLLNNKDYKNNDKNYNIRRGYRSKNTFAFDLITNWALERSIIPYLHKYSGLDCSEFELNPNTCDFDTKLGWDSDINDSKPRKINSNYDFVTTINDEIHNIELKSMFVGNRSANLKIYCTPKDKDNLDKYHILFLHFNGLGNPRFNGVLKETKFEIYNIPWSKLINSHIHYPPQLDRKPCYLIHFEGENKCERFDVNNKSINEIKNDKECFILDKPIIKNKIRYDEFKPYLISKNDNLIKDILSAISK